MSCSSLYECVFGLQSNPYVPNWFKKDDLHLEWWYLLYNAMSLGLKNDRAIYQRLVTLSIQTITGKDNEGLCWQYVGEIQTLDKSLRTLEQLLLSTMVQKFETQPSKMCIWIGIGQIFRFLSCKTGNRSLGRLMAVLDMPSSTIKNKRHQPYFLRYKFSISLEC